MTHVLKSSLKSNRGSILPIAMLIMFVGVVMIAIVGDIAIIRHNKIKLQQISDAAALSGAHYGKQGYKSVVDNTKRAIIYEKDAEKKAKEIVKKNSKEFPKGSFTIKSVEFNPTNIDSRGRTSRDQYYSGDFTVRIKGKGSNLLTDFFSGLFEIEAVSKTHAHPD